MGLKIIKCHLYSLLEKISPTSLLASTANPPKSSEISPLQTTRFKTLVPGEFARSDCCKKDTFDPTKGPSQNSPTLPHTARDVPGSHLAVQRAARMYVHWQVPCALGPHSGSPPCTVQGLAGHRHRRIRKGDCQTTKGDCQTTKADRRRRTAGRRIQQAGRRTHKAGRHIQKADRRIRTGEVF